MIDQHGLLFFTREDCRSITAVAEAVMIDQHGLLFFTDGYALVADIDAERIGQVLTNLIGNAIKYSPDGGDIIISVWEERESHAVGISVQDHGIGIPRHQHAQIFGRFMRADKAAACGISGTGLGLYLCRELVERHEGRLWFESEEGAGSTFSFTLPLYANQSV